MRLYIAPLFWLTMGALAMGFNLCVASSRFQARLSADRLAQVQKGYSQRFPAFWSWGTGAYCTFAAIRTLISGVDTWWLWFLAAAVQFGTLPIRHFAAVKLGAADVRLGVEMQRRHRRALWFAGPATVCVFAAGPVAESAARLDNGLVGAVGVVLMVAALAGFTAAGWAAVWASNDPVPDKESTTPSSRV